MSGTRYTISIAAKRVDGKDDHRQPRVVDDIFEFAVRADSLNEAIIKATKHMEAEYEEPHVLRVPNDGGVKRL